MIRKTGNRLKRLATGTNILRRQASKRGKILSKYREESIRTSVLKSGDSIKGLLFKASDLHRGHRLLMAKKKEAPKNWFVRFLDKARSRLYSPDSEIMTRLKVRFEYNLALRPVEELYEL